VSLGGKTLETRVDSELARYYAEKYLQGHRERPDLDLLIDQAVEQGRDRPLDGGLLKRLAGELSVDFAALFLAQWILEDAPNRNLRVRLTEEVDTLRTAESAVTLPSGSSSYVFLFVPGFLYRATSAETGADLAVPRRALTLAGIENHLLEIDQSGSIERNAARIAEDVTRHAVGGRRIVLVSASTGGASVAQALGEILDSGERHRVAAWLNISGLLRGSFLADLALHWSTQWLVRLRCLLAGWSFAGVTSLETRRSRERFDRLKIPPEILIVNYFGIPLSGDVTPRAQAGYRDLSGEGPNDGLTLLCDCLVPGRLTVAELGYDHFLRDPEGERKTLALARLLIDHLESRKR
jgi:hypothetical protein